MEKSEAKAKVNKEAEKEAKNLKLKTTFCTNYWRKIWNEQIKCYIISITSILTYTYLWEWYEL